MDAGDSKGGHARRRDLAALLGLSVSAVSHQLRLLRSLRLVKYRKEGRLAYYSLDDDHTGQLLHDVLEHVWQVL